MVATHPATAQVPQDLLIVRSCQARPGAPMCGGRCRRCGEQWPTPAAPCWRRVAQMLSAKPSTRTWSRQLHHLGPLPHRRRPALGLGFRVLPTLDHKCLDCCVTAHVTSHLQSACQFKGVNPETPLRCCWWTGRPERSPGHPFQDRPAAAAGIVGRRTDSQTLNPTR